MTKIRGGQLVERIALAVALGLVLSCHAGCNNDSGLSESGADGGEIQKGRKQFVTIGTAPAGGAFAPVGNAIANVVESNKGSLNWDVKPETTKGTQENIRRLAAGELEFGMANAAISYFAVQGQGAWKKPFAIRAVATLAPNVGIFVTTRSTGIESISDLKGKRVVLGPAGAGFDYFLKPLLAAHDVSYDDLTVLNGNYLSASDMLADGRADAAFMGGAIPIPAVVQLCASQDVIFLKFADDALEKLKEYPFYFAVPVKADVYSDLEEELTGINVGNMQLISHENVDADIVYNFLKKLYENRTQLVEKHPAGKALNPDNAARSVGTPFHPGAIRFYREAGIWPAE